MTLAAHFVVRQNDPSTIVVDASASTGSPNRYRIDFGDGYTTMQASPICPHKYAASGTYTIEVTAENEPDFSSSSQDVFINTNVPGNASKISPISFSNPSADGQILLTDSKAPGGSRWESDGEPKTGQKLAIEPRIEGGGLGDWGWFVTSHWEPEQVDIISLGLSYINDSSVDLTVMGGLVVENLFPGGSAVVEYSGTLPAHSSGPLPINGTPSTDDPFSMEDTYWVVISRHSLTLVASHGAVMNPSPDDLDGSVQIYVSTNRIMRPNDTTFRQIFG